MDYRMKKLEEEKMKRVNAIVNHPLFKEGMEQNRICEQNRIFCKHDMDHFLDVARLAYIFSMERNYKLDKELIYAAALLHDIGRWQQYTQGIPHDKAGARTAEKILKDTEFSCEEKKMIICAIEGHRNTDHKSPLSEILYDADKISRNCYACCAEQECNWNDEKKNLHITW